MIEIWKDITGYEGIYQVSNLGNVKTLSRIVLNHGVNPFTSKEKIMKTGLLTNGKLMVRLRKNNVPKTFQVHVLVAIEFLGHVPCGHKIIVDHINNNPLDNRVVNLQLITQRANASKDVRKGSSDYIGVSWCKKNNKWYSCIQINGKNKNLGLFSTEIEAHNAYQSKLKSIA